MIKPHPVRVYADTSVIGGVFDKEFMTPSEIFFKKAHEGKFRLVTSVVVWKEIEMAPDNVQAFFRNIASSMEIQEITQEAVELQRKYIKAGILSPKWIDDALHVALATVANCGLIVSWNFKHIVNFKKAPLYNGINMANGYPSIGIFSPLEVIEDA